MTEDTLLDRMINADRSNETISKIRSEAHQLRMFLSGTGGDVTKALRILESMDDNRNLLPAYPDGK